jgi:hypothetical protein
MSVRRRKWKTPKGEIKEAWIVDFRDASGNRRCKTFRLKHDADRFASVATAVGSGAIPEPLTKGYRPIEFVAPIADNGDWKKAAGREMIAAALRNAHPGLKPTTESVVVHVVAEMSPSSAVADVDNLLKPVLDSLKGVAWMDDTQVCELLVRRIPSRKRCMHVKIWHMPGRTLLNHLNALAEAGFTSV